MTTKSVAATIMHEIMQLNRKGVFDDQATLEINEENGMEVKVTLTPTTGLFAGTSIPFDFEFSDSYPASAPNAVTSAVIYHSNIGEDGNICLNMFSEPDPSYRIEHYINGLLWLLNNQNFNSQLNGYVTTNRKLFSINFSLACMGYTINSLACTNIRNAPPNNQEIRKLIANIISYHSQSSSLKYGLERSFSELKSFFPEKSHFQFIAENIPLLQIISKKDSFDGTLLFVDSVCTQVDVRATKLRTESRLVLKEMLISLDGELTLLLTNGTESIDVSHLEESLKKKVEIPKAGDLKRTNQANICEVSIANWTGPVLLDRSLLTEERFFASTGYPRLIVKARLADLLSLRPDLLVSEVQVKRIPKVPTVDNPSSSNSDLAEETSKPKEAAEVQQVVVVEETKPTESSQNVLPPLEAIVEEKSITVRESSAKKDSKVASLAVDSLLNSRTLSDEAAVTS